MESNIIFSTLGNCDVSLSVTRTISVSFVLEKYWKLISESPPPQKKKIKHVYAKFHFSSMLLFVSIISFIHKRFLRVTYPDSDPQNDIKEIGDPKRDDDDINAINNDIYL